MSELLQRIHAAPVPDTDISEHRIPSVAESFSSVPRPQVWDNSVVFQDIIKSSQDPKIQGFFSFLSDSEPEPAVSIWSLDDYSLVACNERFIELIGMLYFINANERELIKPTSCLLESDLGRIFANAQVPN
jgi:hypothetical protein